MLELKERKYYGPKPFVLKTSHEATSFLPSYGAETKFTLENREGPSSCHHSAKALPSARHPGLPMTPTAYRHLQTTDTGETSTDKAHQLHERLSQRTKRRRSRGSRSSKASTTSEASTTHQQSETGNLLPYWHLPLLLRGRRRKVSLPKSPFQTFVERKAMPMRLPMPLGHGLDLSRTIMITTRTHT